jgi:drug/metabolite transporter (DMT)-like permease
MGAGSSVAALGPVFGLSAAAVWGAADFSGGVAARRAAPAFVVAVAHGFSLILLLVAALLLHTASGSYGLYGLLSGVFCGAGLVAFYSALSRGSMGLSAAICGVLTAVIPVAFTWLGQGHASPRRLTGFVVAAVAIWLVAYTPEPESAAPPHAHSPRSHSLWLAAIAGVCFGTMLVFMHFAAAQGIVRALIAMRLTSTAVAALPGTAFWLVKRREGPARAGFPSGKILWLAVLAGVLDTSGNLLYLLASLAGRLDIAAVLSSLYPAGTILLAAWLLKERTSRSQAIGMTLALAAVVLIAI